MSGRFLWIAWLTLAANAAFGADISRSFDVTPGGTLDVDADVGSIEVMPGADDKLVVEVDVSGRDADRLEVEFDQAADGVRVKARLKDRGHRYKSYSLNARFRATVPGKYNVILDTAGGSIEVGDLDGEVRADTAGGSIIVGRVTGPVKADTAGGGIEIEASLKDVNADTAGGSIRLGEMHDRVRADTAGGSIRIDVSSGPVHASTSGGGISLRAASGPVDASTSGGSVDVSFVGQPDDDSELDTSGGSITAVLADGLKFDIDARSGSRVKSDFDLDDARVEDDRLQGKLNGGGPRLRLSSSGPVRIEKP